LARFNGDIPPRGPALGWGGGQMAHPCLTVSFFCDIIENGFQYQKKRSAFSQEMAHERTELPADG
jgi:hypothetical protein